MREELNFTSIKSMINLDHIYQPSDDYPECNNTEIPDFETDKVGTVLKSLPGKNVGESTASGTRIVKIMLSHQKLIYQSVSMSTNDSKVTTYVETCSPEKSTKKELRRKRFVNSTRHFSVTNCV